MLHFCSELMLLNVVLSIISSNNIELLLGYVHLALYYEYQ